MGDEIKMKVDLEGFAKGITAQHLALVQLLLEKGVLANEDMERYGRLINRMFDAQEQALAEKRDEQLRSLADTDPDKYEAVMYLRRVLCGESPQPTGGAGNTEGKQGMGRVVCTVCNKVVSNEVEGKLMVRAYIQCPECVEKESNFEAERNKLIAAVGEVANVHTTEQAVEIIKSLIQASGKEVRARYLKAILMEMGNRLVMLNGYDPAMPRPQGVVEKPNTTILAAFADFMNSSVEARNHLRDLGLFWTM
jgi:hypothetical protein